MRRSRTPASPIRLPLLAVAMALGAACNQGDDGDFDFGDQTGGTLTTTVTMTSTPATGSESTAVDPTSTTAADTDVDPPTGSEGSESGTDEGTTTEDLPTQACTTLDVLIVIDNSDTMAEEQVRFGVAIAPFLTLLNQQLPGIAGSIHIAVLTTDAPEFVTSTPAMTCTPYSSGASWMTFGPDTMTELACATAVGTAGDPDERPLQMTIEALSPEMQGIDGANEGFLRESGPLVILFLTDEEDDFEEVTEWGSVGDPADWVDAIAATQDGHVQDVVPLSLVGTDPPNACPPYQWNHVDGAEIATRIIEFTESFPRQAVGDLCAVEYTTFLNSAVAAVTTACNQWVPE